MSFNKYTVCYSIGNGSKSEFQGSGQQLQNDEDKTAASQRAVFQDVLIKNKSASNFQDGC